MANGRAKATQDEVPKLLDRLAPVAQAHELIVQKGNKIVEVRLASITKGSAARQLLAKDRWDFVMAAGDDATDEDMFAAMPPNACTVKVGPGQTLAKSRVSGPQAFTHLLESLI